MGGAPSFSMLFSTMSFKFSGSGPAPTAGVRPTANAGKAEVHQTLVHQPKQHVNEEEKRVSSTDVEGDGDPSNELTLLPFLVRGTVLSAMGKSVKSRGRTGGLRVGKSFTRDGTLFNNVGRPAILRVPSNNKPFRVVQSYEIINAVNSSATLATFTSFYFMISSLDQLASLANVFDQYKIERIEVWLTPHVSSNVASNDNPGLFHSVIDFDDAALLTTLPQALDYTNVLVGSGLDGHYRTWVPHVAVASYSGAFNSYTNVTAPWIDAVSANVQHYGLKTAWSTTGVIYSYDMVVRLHTVWRNVR